MKSAPLASSLNLRLSGVPALVRKASLIVLAFELETLHQRLGYKGAGSGQAYRSEGEAGERQTWEGFCKHHAGITVSTYRLYLKCGRVVMDRLRADSRPKAEELIGAMERGPSLLNDGQRQVMIDDMVRLVITTEGNYSGI